jgi:glutamate synthase (NADPH/NADH) small chain
VLCEQACVRNTHEDKPVEIGQLQRFATDAYFAKPGAPLFTRAAATGRRIAVVGAGPAGLACAHGLARLGHAVVVFDANSKPGGLNEYGLATYKTIGDFAQKEVAWLLSIGGIEVRNKTSLGRDLALESLVADFDAVFLGLGLAGVNAIGIAEPTVAGLRNAVEFIAELRQAHAYAQVPVGRKVVVIGGGMTAVDASVEWAQKNGVTIRHWAAPKEVLSAGGQVTGVRFATTRMDAGKLVETGATFTLAADMVLKAIGQSFIAQPLGALVNLQGGRIRADSEGRTSHAKVWAGGDCRVGGRDLTVEAVEHGKVAALSIHAALGATTGA